MPQGSKGPAVAADGLRHALIAAAALAAVSCAAAAGHGSPQRRLAVVDGLSAPEALIFDPRHDAYFVSNVNGEPGVKDGNGFISRIRADGTLDSLHFIQGGRGGVTLNGPMGSRVRGDTLWVLDVDALRAFDPGTGKPLAAIDLAPAGALFLNDLALAPDGGFYATDMQLRVAGGKMTPAGPGRIYHIGRDHRVAVAIESPALSAPDGIDWDPRAQQYIVAPFSTEPVMSWRPGDKAPRNVAPSKGRTDGVEVEKDGSILITAWNDSTVSTLEGTRLVPRIGPLDMTPADVSLDARRHHVGIVSMEANRFELWTWTPR
jgi:sugar lactone lactonase YvrE